MSNMTKPMLAAKLEWDKLRFPVLVSPKVDGVRCVIKDGKPMSRSWKLLRNRHFQEWVREHQDLLEHMDGEVVVGSATAPNVYNASTSGIMSEWGTPDFTYLVFDYTEDLTDSYWLRLQKLKLLCDGPNVPPQLVRLPQYKAANRTKLEELEERLVGKGYEGVIVRSRVLSSRYKTNRSTATEGYLLKLKRYQDDEAFVVGCEELLHNDNPAFLDAQGHTKHTAHKAGQRAGDTLGALKCKMATGIEFSIGTGFDMATRDALWAERETLPGRIVKFKHMPHGKLVAPRHPVFLGFRHEDDM